MDESIEASSIEIEDSNSFLDDEIEALQSIYVSETEVFKEKQSTILSIDLHPATADNLHEQYVKLTLKLTMTEEYPEVIPEIVIRNPRGLSDDKLNSIVNDLVKIAEDKKGNSMLFEIIEAAKEHITVGNRPCEECAICLYGFHDDDIFTKTECYHYFHSHCLARYVRDFVSKNDLNSPGEAVSQRELLCPVCRLPINFDESEESFPPPTKGQVEDYVATEEVLELQKKMSDLFHQQVQKGGIIDLEAEKNKYLIEISSVPSVIASAPELELEGDEVTQSAIEDNAVAPTAPCDFEESEDKEDQSSCAKIPICAEGAEGGPVKNYGRGVKHNDGRNRRYNEGARMNKGYRNERPAEDRRNDKYRDIRYKDGQKIYKNEADGKNDRYDTNVQPEKYNRERISHKYRDIRITEGQRNKSDGYKRNDNHDGNGSHEFEREKRSDGYKDIRIKEAQRSEDQGENRQETRGNEMRNDGHRDSRNKEGQINDKIDGEEVLEECDIEKRNERHYAARNDEYDGERRNERYGMDRRNTRYNEERRGGRYNSRRNEGYRRNYRYNNYRGGYNDRRNESYDGDRRSNKFDGRNDSSNKNEDDNRNDGDRNEGTVRNEGKDRYNSDRRNDRFDGSKKFDRYNGYQRNGRFNGNQRNFRYNGPRRNDRYNYERNNRFEGGNSRNDYDTEVHKNVRESVQQVDDANYSAQSVENSETPISAEVATEDREFAGSISDSENVGGRTVSERNQGFGASDQSSNYRNKFADRNSGSHRRTPVHSRGRNYTNYAQYPNDRRYNPANAYPKQYNKDNYNYPSQRRHSKSQSLEKEVPSSSDANDGGISENQISSSDVMAESIVSEPNIRNSRLSEVKAVDKSEEDGAYDEPQSTERGTRGMHSFNDERGPRGGRYHRSHHEEPSEDRLCNSGQSYKDSRSHRSYPNAKNRQNDASKYRNSRDNPDRRYQPRRYAQDTHSLAGQDKNGSEAKPEAMPKGTVPAENVANGSEVSSKTSADAENPVPTSNFLPPMASVAPPPGFLNPSRKIVYGLAAANPPPGFNRR